MNTVRTFEHLWHGTAHAEVALRKGGTGVVRTVGHGVAAALLYGLGAAAGTALLLGILGTYDVIFIASGHGTNSMLWWPVAPSSLFYYMWVGIMGVLCALMFWPHVDGMKKRPMFLLGLPANILSTILFAGHCLVRGYAGISTWPRWPCIVAILPCYPLIILAVVTSVRRRTRWSLLAVSLTLLVVFHGLATVLTAVTSRAGARRAATGCIVRRVHACALKADPQSTNRTCCGTVIVVNRDGTAASTDIVRYVQELGMTVLTSAPPQQMSLGPDFPRFPTPVVLEGDTFAVAPCIVVCEMGYWTNTLSLTTLRGWFVYFCFGRYAVVLIPFI